MPRRLLLAVLAPCLASCASGTIYESRDEDAVPIYRAQIGRFPKLPDCVRSAFARERADRARVEEAIETFAPLLEELSRAASARHCRWTYDVPPSITGDYPLEFMLAAARTFVVRSRILWEKADFDGALQDLLVLCRVGSDLLQDRWLIGRLIGVICTIFACEELGDRLSAGQLQQRHLELVRIHLEALDRRYPEFRDWIRQEREMAIPLIEQIRDVGLPEVVRRVAKDKDAMQDSHPITDEWHAWLQGRLRTDLDRSKKIILERWSELMRPIEAAVSRPLQSKALDDALELVRTDGKELSLRMARHILGGGVEQDEAMRDAAQLVFMLWIPPANRIAQQHAIGHLQLQTIVWGCRLELQRLKTGGYPDSLREIAEETPDPFDGGKLKYRRIVKLDGEGFVLTVAGSENDPDHRIRLLSEECRFDKALYESRISARVYDVILGVFRRR